MTEYGYVYRETDPDATVEEEIAVCERNVRESLLWDRWRAENTPTAEAIRVRALSQFAVANGRNGSPAPPPPPVGLSPSVGP